MEIYSDVWFFIIQNLESLRQEVASSNSCMTNGSYSFLLALKFPELKTLAFAQTSQLYYACSKLVYLFDILQ